MKEHEKWLHEELTDEAAKKFELETPNVATVDEVINTVSETAWRGALKWIKEECIYTEDDGHLCIDWEMINKELEE